MAESFGALLRKCRADAGMSMGELARQTTYSKSYLSKIENDLKPPSLAMARRFDSVLGTGGVLSALVQSASTPEVTGQSGDDQTGDDEGDEVWVMSLVENGDLHFRLHRRQVLAGAGTMLGVALTKGIGLETDERTIAALRASHNQLRELGRLTSPVAVLGPVIAQVHSLRTLAEGNAGPARSELLLLASRVAEYAGWMSQEAGDERGAVWWTRRAVSLAEQGQDRGLARYALVREAELALYRQDGVTTVELARRAQADGGVDPRILGLAARCEAQGYALAGDVDGYRRALDRATEQLSMARVDGGTAPPLGSSSVADEVSLARGWALCDLGYPAESAAVLDAEVANISATARRARARFGTRLALAHAYSGEIDQACVVSRDVLDDVLQVDSATVRVDLRQLARTLARWRTHGAVKELYPDLTRALTKPQPVG